MSKSKICLQVTPKWERNGNSTHASQKCKVREHPVTGPYVENVKEYNIENYTQFLKLLAKGNSSRSTASTSMNDKSSRSHAIITLTLKQTKFENLAVPAVILMKPTVLVMQVKRWYRTSSWSILLDQKDYRKQNYMDNKKESKKGH